MHSRAGAPAPSTRVSFVAAEVMVSDIALLDPLFSAAQGIFDVVHIASVFLCNGYGYDFANATGLVYPNPCSSCNFNQVINSERILRGCRTQSSGLSLSWIWAYYRTKRPRQAEVA